MSEYHVGIIAEGPTDISLIKGIVRCAFPDGRFVFRTISPTEEELKSGRKEEGFGWGGVYKVCQGLQPRLKILEAAGMGLDFLIVHVDGDVAYSSYRDANLKTERTDLPCAHDGDPVRRIGEVLQKIVSSWLMNAIEPARRVFCLPFINTEAWAGYLAYTEYRRIFSEQSSEEEINRWLLMAGGKKANQRKRFLRKKGGRVRKNRHCYQLLADDMTTEVWNMLSEDYVQASQFDSQLKKTCLGLRR